MQIGSDFLATRGATQRECAQPCSLPSSLGSLWRMHRSHAFLLLGNRTEAAPPRGKGEKGSSSDSESKVETYKNHQVPFQGYISVTPSPGFSLSFWDSVS